MFEKIEKIRKANNLSIAQLVRNVGISKTAYYCYKHGTRVPKLTTILKFSNYFGIDYKYFIFEGGDENVHMQ